MALFKAAGDDYSFIEGRSGYSADPPVVVDLEGDHYGVLEAPGVAELSGAIHGVLDRWSGRGGVPAPPVPRQRTGDDGRESSALRPPRRRGDAQEDA